MDAQAVEQTVKEPSDEEIPSQELKSLIKHYSDKYKVSYYEMYKIVECETAETFDPTIQSNYYENGVREDSWGLAQINLPSWPDVKKSQAIDKDFALDFLASHLAKKEGYWWSCYKILKNKGVI